MACVGKAMRPLLHLCLGHACTLCLGAQLKLEGAGSRALHWKSLPVCLMLSASSSTSLQGA